MSSPVILSISTIFALVGIVLAAIAFATDNWSEYDVDRERIFNQMKNNVQFNNELAPKINKSRQYFDRTFGLFRVCYPGPVPTGAGSYRSALGSQCVTLTDFQIPEDEAQTALYTDDETLRMHLMRSMVAFYVIGLLFLALTLLTGVCGCWRRHAGYILGTGILLLFATLFLAAAMSVWHGVDYLSREIIRAPGYELNWEEWLTQLTHIRYGWSYIISWVAIALILIASILMLVAYSAMKREEEDEIEKKAAPYMMQSYYDKTALMPYGYGTYPAGYQQGYGNPAAYYQQGYGSPYGSQYAGYGGGQQQQQYGYGR